VSDRIDDPEKWKEDPKEVFEEWISYANYSKRTQTAYLWIFGKLTDFLKESQISFEKLNNAIFRKFMMSISSSRISRRIYSRQLSTVLSHLTEIGLIGDNPAIVFLSMEKGRTGRKLPDVLSKEETELFLKFLPNGTTWEDSRIRTILQLLLGTGLRLSEAAALRTEGVVLGENPHLRVLGKGRKERIVPLTESLADLLENFFEVREEHLSRSSPWFFSDSLGNPPSPSGIYRMVSRTLTSAGIVKPSMGPHLLRHTFATRQFEAGIPPAIVKNWMGHSSLATTMIYEHVVGSPGGFRPV